jgi:hypothetical protein
VPSVHMKGDALEEFVYVRPPPGYACAPGMVWRLLCPLYGLKQAPRAWTRALRTELEPWHMLGTDVCAKRTVRVDVDCTSCVKQGGQQAGPHGHVRQRL